jgi:signal transduction histidine kinase
LELNSPNDYSPSGAANRLNALAGGMVELLRRILGETTEIETRLAEALPMIIADPGQVENTLLNLAINARDAMPNGGRLVIETAHTPRLRAPMRGHRLLKEATSAGSSRCYISDLLSRHKML